MERYLSPHLSPYSSYDSDEMDFNDDMNRHYEGLLYILKEQSKFGAELKLMTLTKNLHLLRPGFLVIKEIWIE